MQNHRRDGGFAVASGDDQAFFGVGCKPQKLGIALNLQVQLLCADQFGVVGACVHAQDDNLNVRSDSACIPAFLFGKEAGSSQPATTRLEDLIVAS
ncbi:MAG: hypothetical protein ACPH97_03440, partial [Flavobacteriales bacterium]